MSYQPYSSDPTEQGYYERETGGQHPHFRPAEQGYQRPQVAGQPDQSYQQPYLPNPNQGYQHTNQPYQPDQSYSQPYYPPVQQGYQHMPYQGNQPPYSEPGVVGPSNGVIRRADMGAVQAESRYETYRDPMGNLVESRQQVYEDQNQVRNNIRYWATTGITFVLSALEIILLLRFIFRLLDANKDAGFIAFLYGLSHPFVVAFSGIFNDQTLGRSGVFEASTLIAMIIYALLAWGLITLVKLLFAPVQASHQSVTTTRRSQL